MTNSAYYHIVPYDCQNFYMHDFEIYVDIVGQLELHNLFLHDYPKEFVELGDMKLEIPIFPLNTDGVDIYGRNFTFRNVKITNFDDAIVPKPSNKGHKYQCTEDILVENCEVTFGVGMTIGSVPPNDQHACVRNVTFRDIVFNKPLKGIYVKTNPGNHGDGEIRNIVYENIVMDTPIWWAVYIGPQQQHQPGGAGPGCMIYPLNKVCPTQPRIDVSDITLRNVTSKGGLLPAGIIRCNATNPCKNFVFEDVDIRSEFWDFLNYGFIVEYIEGTTKNVFPDPKFKAPGFYDNEKNRLIDETFSLEKELYYDKMFYKLLSVVTGIKI